jgi:hemoglobin-like flavoprotein
LFGFSNDIDMDEIRGSSRFKMHASFLIEMIEKALNMLGVEDSELSLMLSDLGKKHVAYGVEPEYFPFMNESILEMLRHMLKDSFTPTDQEAWGAVLDSLIADMTRAQRELQMMKIAETMVI